MLFNDPATLEPDRVLDWHELCSAGLDREQRNLHECLLTKASIPAYLKSVTQFGVTINEINAHFMSCKQELDISAVLILITAAEARIRRDVERRTQSSVTQGTLTGRLKRLCSQVDYKWQVRLYENGIMDAWKDYVNTLSAVSQGDKDKILQSIGNFKEVKSLRNWGAHGRSFEFTGIKRYPPEIVANKMKSLYEALREATQLGGIMKFE